MPHIHLHNVSLRYHKYQGRTSGLKETAMRMISPSAWHRKHSPRRTEFWGLRDINLQLDEGTRLGVIGHNGAGKSTLLKVISRIYRPTIGVADVEGKIAPLIEIGAGFHPELTGRENAYLHGAILGIPRREISQRMDSLVQFAELTDFIDTPVKYYSTGMHLRLAYSIATEVVPDILILDELYAGGDEAFIKKANSRLDQFVKQSRILILVAHNMEYIRRFCNRVIVLDHGRMVADGAPDEAIGSYLAHVSGERRFPEVTQ